MSEKLPVGTRVRVLPSSILYNRSNPHANIGTIMDWHEANPRYDYRVVDDRGVKFPVYANEIEEIDK